MFNNLGRIPALLLFTFIFLATPITGIAGVPELINQGDAALQNKDIESAEKLFAQALQKDPENPRILISLTRIKVQLRKYSEASPLVDKVLAMKVSTGRNVLVYMEGKPEPLEAELVDEAVIPSDTGKNNMRNYLDGEKVKPIPHYRLFFKKSGKMKLIPNTQVRIKYVGVLRTVYVEAEELKAKIQKKLIDASGNKGKDEMVQLKGGCFLMGSKKGHPDERPVHEVCLKPFSIDKYEVSQAAFQAKTGENPSHTIQADLPVNMVTWDEAQAFCKTSGKRLPSEAEWEYAARANAKTKFYWGEKFVEGKANFCDSKCELNIRLASTDDAYKMTAPVGSYPPNKFGLHDMAGNLAEWVADWMLVNYYTLSPKKNPLGPQAGNTKVIRGGGWNTNAQNLRPADRSSFQRDFRNEGIGFRCAK